ncbi:MAG: DUF4244 domain-containing protein [Ilumatobacteraceae bacterium]
MPFLLRPYVHAVTIWHELTTEHSATASSSTVVADDGDPDRDRGQATTEYALVMLGAAAVALLVVTWATAGAAPGASVGCSTG